METRCARIKLKPGSMERVRAWAAEINGRQEEALATLRDESIFVESVFLDQTDEGDFLIYYVKAESFERAREVVERSTHAIDDYHKDFKRATFDTRRELELLVDLDRIGEA